LLAQPKVSEAEEAYVDLLSDLLADWKDAAVKIPDIAVPQAHRRTGPILQDLSRRLLPGQQRSDSYAAEKQRTSPNDKPRKRAKLGHPVEVGELPRRNPELNTLVKTVGTSAD
jgi:hypothetical protein